MWGTQQDIIEEIIYTKKRNVAVHSLPVAQQLVVLGFAQDDLVRTCEAVYFRSFEYRVGEFVLYSKASENVDGLPRFGRISSIICPEGSDLIWLAVKPWETGGLVERFNAYVIRPIENAPVHLVDQVDLPLHPPISRWRDYSSAQSYLCLKFKVF